MVVFYIQLFFPVFEHIAQPDLRCGDSEMQTADSIRFLGFVQSEDDIAAAVFSGLYRIDEHIWCINLESTEG